MPWWPEWTTLAECKKYDPEIWFNLGPSGRYRRAAIQRAKRICYQCPVIANCLRENLTVPYGIFGGMTPLERWRLLGNQGYPSRSKPAFSTSVLPSGKSRKSASHTSETKSPAKSAASALGSLRYSNGGCLNDNRRPSPLGTHIRAIA